MKLYGRVAKKWSRWDAAKVKWEKQTKKHSTTRNEELVRASSLGNVHIVRILLSCGAKISFDDFSPVWEALANKHLETLFFFLRKKLKNARMPFDLFEAIVFQACRHGWLSIVKYIIFHQTYSVRFKRLCPKVVEALLCECVGNNQIEILDLFLRTIPPLDTELFQSAKYVAIRLGHLNALKMIMEKQCYCFDISLWSIAAKYKQEDILHYLLQVIIWPHSFVCITNMRFDAYSSTSPQKIMNDAISYGSIVLVRHMIQKKYIRATWDLVFSAVLEDRLEIARYLASYCGDDVHAQEVLWRATRVVLETQNTQGLVFLLRNFLKFDYITLASMLGKEWFLSKTAASICGIGFSVWNIYLGNIRSRAVKLVKK